MTATAAAQQRLAVLEQQLTQPPVLLQMQPTAAADGSMFAGQVIVITGAAKGIGHAAALAFAQRGAKLLLTDLDQQAVQAAAEQCRAAGSPKASVFCARQHTAAQHVCSRLLPCKLELSCPSSSKLQSQLCGNCGNALSPTM
jgi:hypothetical protein